MQNNMNMERKFTAEESEMIKKLSENVIQYLGEIDNLDKRVEELEKRIDESEIWLRRIIFGDNDDVHNSLRVSSTNHVIFFRQGYQKFYKMDIDTLKIERI